MTKWDAAYYSLSLGLSNTQMFTVRCCICNTSKLLPHSSDQWTCPCDFVFTRKGGRVVREPPVPRKKEVNDQPD